MDPVALLIQGVAGAGAANLVALVRKGRSLGPALNTILGLIGGVAGGSLLGGVFFGGTPGMVAMAALTGALLPVVLGWLRPRSTPARHPQ